MYIFFTLKIKIHYYIIVLLYSFERKIIKVCPINIRHKLKARKTNNEKKIG